MSNKITIVDKPFTIDGENYLQYWRTTDVETGIIAESGGALYKAGEPDPFGEERQFSGEAPSSYPRGTPDFSASSQSEPEPEDEAELEIEIMPEPDPEPDH